ncbi:FdtA/QdtA family cupin domain-containing protein [Dokdonella soli]|uniref:sugar 3,4-ketoisomerase n=1 Tax=Dokdonella soli TaxID=529810 RepID=UPI0031CFB31A
MELQNKLDPRGCLTIANQEEISFPVSRVFYVYAVPEDSERAVHAHRTTEQFVIAIHGSFSLDLTDGQKTRTYLMNEPTRGVYVPPMIWDRLYDFTPDAICLVFASTPYDESDYIRDWDSYLEVMKEIRG